MNKKNYHFSALNAWLNERNDFYLLLPHQPKLDQVAAICSLASSLKKSGQSAQVLAPKAIQVKFNQIYGVDKISHQLRGRNFIIDINYPLENVEKINWDDKQDSRVSLIIQSKRGVNPIEETMVSFNKKGGQIKNIISLGINSASELNQILKQVTGEEFSQLPPVVNINKGGDFFGEVKVIDKEASSFSEIVIALMEGLSFSLGPDEANNLLLGLQAATNSFSSELVSADIFEAAAFCLRAGGQLKHSSSSVKNENFNKPKIYRGTSA